MVRAAQIIEGQLDIRIIDHPLENLAIDLKESSPTRFGLSQRSADRPLKGITIYRVLHSHEQVKLPPRTEVTRFLRKPNV